MKIKSQKIALSFWLMSCYPRIIMKNILYISLFFSNLILTQDYHVAKNGFNPGTKDSLLTISKAAKLHCQVQL